MKKICLIAITLFLISNGFAAEITSTSVKIDGKTQLDKMQLFEQTRAVDIEKSNQPMSDQLSNKSAGNCQVVQRISVPSLESQGLAWDAGTLWNSQDIDESNIKRIARFNQSGSLLSSFTPTGDGPMGLNKVGPYLWNVDFLDDKITQYTLTGGAGREINLQSGLWTGLAFDGSDFWVTEWFSYNLYRVNSTTGIINKTIPAPNKSLDEEPEVPYGLAFDGVDLWVSDSAGIFKIDPTDGSRLVSCTQSEFRYGKAFGLTWDGKYLWGGSWITSEIIKISVPSPRTDEQNPTPALDLLLFE